MAAQNCLHLETPYAKLKLFGEPTAVHLDLYFEYTKSRSSTCARPSSPRSRPAVRCRQRLSTPMHANQKTHHDGQELHDDLARLRIMSASALALNLSIPNRVKMCALCSSKAHAFAGICTTVTTSFVKPSPVLLRDRTAPDPRVIIHRSQCTEHCIF